MKRLFKSLTFAAVLVCSLTLAARASTVIPFSTTDFVIGSEIFKEPFTVPQEGTYKAAIEDFGFPNAFDTLVFAITTTSPVSLVDAVDGAGGTTMFTFDGEPGVQYWAHIVAQLSSPTAIGGFGAEVSLIPIPPSLLLLGSGLLGLVVMRRRRQ